jgi:hypothetical protein
MEERMKRFLICLLALSCLIFLIPAAFAAEDAAGTPFFNPTLRVGCAVDAGTSHYTFTTARSPIALLYGDDLTRESHPRFYLGLELPFAVTDRLTLKLGGSWAFSGTEKDLLETGTAPGVVGLRSFSADGANHWATADLLVSYALIRDAGVVKSLSAVAGVRWDYQSMGFHYPYAVTTFNSASSNTIDFRMQTLAPVFGLDCTFTGIKSGVWGGDLELAFLAGPIVWGSEDYHVSYFPGNISRMRMHGDFHEGYIVDVFAEATVLSGKITPAMGASLSVFGEYTHTIAKGEVTGTISIGTPPLRSPFHFETGSDVVVFGLSGALAFDLFGKPKPVTPAPAPVIEPKLEPMSFN